MNPQDEDRRWRNEFAGLPRTLAPRNDPWPAIAARLAGAPARTGGEPLRVRWPLAAAAGVVLALAGTLFFLRQTGDGGSPVPQALPALAEVPGVARSLRQTEREYRAALREFDALAGGPSGREAAFAPSWRSGLIVLEEAERQLMTALREEPDNPYIIEKLVQLHARQLDMLRQYVSAGQASGRRTI